MVAERKPKVAVVSPFLDRYHGTELCVIEWIKHLSGKFDIHIYSQEVRDLDPKAFVPHRIPRFFGPHLFNYSWWFVANHLWRWFDKHFRGIRYDLTVSPGVNCLDADVVCVHVIFGEYAPRNARSVRLWGHRLREWPRVIHRKIYYKLVRFLERRVYTSSDVSLIAVARRTSRLLMQHYGRREHCPVVYAGLDQKKFNPQNRLRMRADARREIGLGDDSFALLLIGNDWRNKGVPVLLAALARLQVPSIKLLLVSRENPAPVRAMIRDLHLEECVHFLPARDDVEFYYAAADAYAGPSLEDSYAIPPAEAMACGLPVIVSAAAGVSEIVTQGVDGLILENPTDTAALATLIQRLYEDAQLRARLGENAARTAQQYTWERAGEEMNAIFEQVLRRKTRPVGETLAQNS